MCEIHYDRIEEKYLVRDPERGLRFWAIAEPRAVAILREIWEEIADALPRRRTTSLKVKGMWINLIPIPAK